MSTTQLPAWLTAAPFEDTLANRLRSNVPQAMQDARRWLVHRGKRPFYVSGAPRSGTLDSPQDLAQMGTFEQAVAALQAGTFDGVGFALGDGWQGIDLDKVDDNSLAHLVPDLPGYVERSPSGKGWHAIGFGTTFDSLASDGSGLEAYSGRRYFTVTGDEGRGQPECLAQFVRERVAPLRRHRADRTGQQAYATPTEWKDLASALSAIPPSCSRDEWIRAGMALKVQGEATGQIERAFEMWDTWSAGDPAKYPSEREMLAQWRSFQSDKASAVGPATLLHIAQRHGWTRPAPDVSGLFGSTGEPVSPAALLKPVSVFDVLTSPSPPPGFVWEGYLPRGVVALLGAHGGTGKSTIALMLAVSVAMGRPLFGKPTSAAPAVFVSLEDSAAIVRHRLAGICRLWDVDPGSLADRLHIVDGTENPELFAADSRSAGDVTPAYHELGSLVEKTGAGLVVVDNASDAFGGDEIQRRQVRAFMRSLGQVARLTDCSVLLLAHVDKNTSRSGKADGGEGYSGSTAWHNSARSRLFMTRSENGLLTLEHQKSNLAQRCKPIKIEWPEGGLPTLTSGPDGTGVPETDGEKAVALLGLIFEFEGRGQYASPETNARNNVHALLKGEPAFQSLSLNREATARILNQCQRSGFIESLEYRGSDRRPRQRWTVTSKGRDVARLGTQSETDPMVEKCVQ